MEIRIGSLSRDANEAHRRGVWSSTCFRAFTTAAIAFDRGAERITLVAEVEEALEIRKKQSGHRRHLDGRGGWPPPGRV